MGGCQKGQSAHCRDGHAPLFCFVKSNLEGTLVCHLTALFQTGNFCFQKIHRKVWADKKGDRFLYQRVLSNREKMNGAIVPDFLEDLKLAGVFAEDDETFGAENLLGKRIQQFFESTPRHKCRKRNFTGGEVMLRMVMVVFPLGVVVFCIVAMGFVSAR